MTRTVKYAAARGYAGESFFESDDLVEATRAAVAGAMSTGTTITVKRSVIHEDERRIQGHTIDLFRVAPNEVDFRRVAPELVLATQAMAAELFPEITDFIAPKVEGSEQ